MGKLHCKEISFDQCNKREFEWLCEQNHLVLYNSIVSRFQIFKDDVERTIPKLDLELIREITSVPKPTMDGVISKERYSPFEHGIADRIDHILQSTNGNEAADCALLQMVACDCILEASKISADCFIYKGIIYTYKSYKPVKEAAEMLTELGYYVLKTVQALSADIN